MRLTAPALAGAAVALAAALAWYFRQHADPPFVPGSEATLTRPTPVADSARPRASDTTPLSSGAEAPPGQALAVEARPAPTLERAPLPGETPSTPMTNLMTERQRDVPPQLAEGEREFAAEPVDAAWAPGAEADLLAKFAQMPGLKLIDLQVECRSTMCRLQMTQPSGQRAAEGGRQPFNLLRDSIGLVPRWMNVVGDASGSMKSVAYFWRDGYAPPPREAQVQ